MKSIRVPVILAAILLAASPGRSTAPEAIPPNGGEQFHYSINWPTGLSLGEAMLSGSRGQTAGAAEKLTFQFHLDAAVPGFQVTDTYRSVASPAYCSAEFDKTYQHGPKHVDEKETFTGGSAKRETKGGGESDFDTRACPKDALTYLAFLRDELSHGRLPQEETVYYGAPYRLRIEFKDTEPIDLGGKKVDADRLQATVRGDSAGVTFDVFFLKDAARTLALVRVPLSMGTFSMVLDK